MTEIFHDVKPMFGFNTMDRTWPDDFELVAFVETNNLEEIFEMTNHITHPWHEQESKYGLKVMKKSPRSTSVGDIVVNSEGIVFLCLPVGWKEIGRNDKKVVIPSNFGREPWNEEPLSDK